MSSTPFCLGLPVVDKLSPVQTDTSFILRARDRKDAWHKIMDLQNQMTVHDEISVCEIGMRPDHPIPVARHFSKVRIIPGRGMPYMDDTLRWGWVQQIKGARKDD